MVQVSPDYGDDMKLHILNEIGKLAQGRFNQNLFFGGKGYNLRLFMNTLKFEPNLDTFENEYWIDTGDAELTKKAYYFEYGTGMHNSKGPKRMIKSRSIGKMKFKGTKKFKGQIIYADEVKGVKPVFMMTRAVESVRNERNILEYRIISRLR